MKLKKFMYVFVLMLLSSVGVFFGCSNKYQNMKMTTDLTDSSIVLIYGDEEKNSTSFNIKIEGVGDDVSKKIKYPYVSNNGLLDIAYEQVEGSNSTKVMLKAINYGQTDLIFNTEEGGKSLTLHVDVQYPVESLVLQSDYNPFGIIGQTTKINTAKLIEYQPVETTQRDVVYSMESNYSGVELLADGTIVVDDYAVSGSFTAKVTSKYNDELSETFTVWILKGVQEITALYSNEIIAENDELFISSNMLEESYKIVEFDVEPRDFEYLLEYKILDANGNVISTYANNSKITSPIADIDIIDSTTIGITAGKTVGQATLEVYATVSGFEYKSVPTSFALHNENVAKTINAIDVTDNKYHNSYVLYDDYQGAIGKGIKITTGGADNIENTDFVVRLKSGDARKVGVYTGLKDSSGRLVEVALFDENSSNFDLLTNGTVLYFLTNKDGLDGNDALDVASFEFVAHSTIGRAGQETKTEVTFNLRKGISQINISDDTGEPIPVAIKEVVSGQTIVDSTEVVLNVSSSEYTESIFTESKSDGYVVENNSVKYEDSVQVNTERQFTFKIYGVKEGTYTLTFSTPNGVTKDVRIKVFTKINAITLTTASIEQNSDIGEIEYITTQSGLKTLDGGKITIKTGAIVQLNLNPYFDKYLKNTTFKDVTYDYGIQNSVRIDRLLHLIGYEEGDATVKIIVHTYDDTTTGIYEITFKVHVYIAIQSLSLNAKNVTIYAQDTLGDYAEDGVSNKDKYGTFTFVLKINPQKNSLNEEDIIMAPLDGFVVEKAYYKSEGEMHIKVAKTTLGFNTQISTKLILSLTQYQRTFLAEAEIVVKKATKIETIYDVQRSYGNTLENATTYTQAPSDLKNGTFDYYMYFDARDMKNPNNMNFNILAKTEPVTALDSKLVYVYRPYDDDSKTQNLIINNNNVLIMGTGLAYIDVCAVDSYNADTGFATKVTILVKVADGLSRRTSLEISKASDLVKINNNLESLERFYVVTKDINLSSVSNWTPIGYINGEVYEFNGVFNGLIDDDFGDKTFATITGLKLTNSYEYLGLFAKLGSSARVENVNVSVLNIVNDSDKRTYIGGICGENNGEIFSTSATFLSGAISGADVVFGGIAGKNNGTIYDSYTSGTVDINAINHTSGGIAGINSAEINGNTKLFNDADMYDSYNVTMTINAPNSAGSLGGIAGESSGTIYYASFEGELNGKDNVGGIVGKLTPNETMYDLFNTYSSGTISGVEKVGGLVGLFEASAYKVSNIVNIANSSVNMFDSELSSFKISGTNYVGGLVGYATNIIVKNAYVRSYVTESDYDGDMYVENGFAGGLIGFANNAMLEKTYSIIKINATGEPKIAGLVGEAENVTVTTSFERNSYKLLPEGGSAESKTVFYSEKNCSVYDFYSSNVEDDSEFNVSKITEHITSNSSEISTNNWYLSTNSTYPFIIFEDDGEFRLLTVEAPAEIKITRKGNGYLYNLKDYLDENSEEVENSFVLYKGRTSAIKFANLFDVTIVPNDELLNVSKAYMLTSSNSNVVQITGKTQNDYRLKFNGTGKVVLTITSKMNSKAKTEITLYVLNAVRGFDLKLQQNLSALLVGSNYELISTFDGAYPNSNDFFICFESPSEIYLNNDNSLKKFVKNNEKIFIKSEKSGNFEVKYKLYSKIDNYYIPLGNDTGNGMNEDETKKEFDFVYGIKDLVADAYQLETGLNDLANITYTLTGDDLRIGENLPNINANITNDDLSKYWNVKLLYVNVYCGETLSATIIESEMSSNTFNDKVTKIEYKFEISPNTKNVEGYFKSHAGENNIVSNLSLKASIVDNMENAPSYALREVVTTLVVNRQKIDNIALLFFANAEKIKDENNNDVYTINETPSSAIVAGQAGIMKIAIAPNNAEVKRVEVTYSNANNYTLSLNQVLRHENGNNVNYIDRKPYAIATNNGKGIELYNTESNYVVDTEGGTIYTTYDGYLYVSCLLSSNVPSGTQFVITVDAIYTSGYKYTISKTLTSRYPSSISFGYNFEYDFNEKTQSQKLDSYVVVPQGIEKEFYIDYVEIFDADEISKFESVVAPNEVIQSSNSNITFDFKRVDGKVKQPLMINNSTLRVYYTMTTSSAGETTIQIKKTKVQNAIENTYMSNKITIVSVPYVVNGISIVDGGNNIFKIAQSTPRQLDVKLSVETSLDKDENILENGTKSINNKLKEFENQIKTTYSYWFGRAENNTVYNRASESNNSFANYYISKTSEGILNINVSKVRTTAVLYVEMPFSYENLTAELIRDDEINITKIGDREIGFTNKVQYIRDFVTLNLTNDESEENPIPLYSAEDFVNMSSGAEDTTLYYALANDIVLNDYISRDLDYVVFNGNGHTITIANFITNENDTYYSNYGLFNKIGENAIVKNLNVRYATNLEIDVNEYSLIEKDNTKNEFIVKNDITLQNVTFVDALNSQDFDITEFNFGAVAVTNEGIIYNTKVYAQNNKKLSFVGNTTIQNNISGFVCTNNGYISYSTSELSLSVNCGYVAGFADINSYKISNSKVLLQSKFNGTSYEYYGAIENTFTNDEMSLTAGFVAKNNGTIFGSYISGYLIDEYGRGQSKDAVISSYSTIGAFVNNNSGDIDSCYTDLYTYSSARASGFVYQNSGNIYGSYSATLAQNTDTDINKAFTPFTGTSNEGVYLNTGVIDSCYYIVDSDSSSITDELATVILREGLDKSSFKSSFDKFIFATDDYNGTWRFNDLKNPTLIDADMEIYSHEICTGVKTENIDGQNKSHYVWEFRKGAYINIDNNWEEQDNPEFGKKGNKRINPRIVSSMEQLDSILEYIQTDDENQNDFVVLICDIIANRDYTPKSSTLKFAGKLLGNNATISNLYLRADINNVNNYFGLFGAVDGNGDRALVKDLKLVAKQVVANSAKCVGTFAGYINNADVANIIVDSSSVEAVQGKNMVGAFAGLINNSNITKISAKGNVNAGYIANAQDLSNFNETNDYERLTNTDNNIAYSYAGTFAGALTGNTEAKFINIEGENKVIGFYAGNVVGLVATESKLTLASVLVEIPTADDSKQFIRAYAFAGGVVGENRGQVERCYIENVNQDLVDADTKNTSTANRNLTFFAGSPKFIGGFVGFNNGGTIKNSYTKLDVFVRQHVTIASGGFAGLVVGGTIENCYATGLVASYGAMGGFIGEISTNKQLCASYENTNKKLVRYDDYRLFVGNDSNGKNDAAFISASNEVKIENCLASNKLLCDKNNISYSIINEGKFGFFIGEIKTARILNTSESQEGSESQETPNDKVILSGNNYFNSQILKSNSNTPKNTDTMKLTDNIILEAIVAEQDGKTAIECLNDSIIGIINELDKDGITQFNAYANLQVYDENSNLDKTKEKVLVSFENLLNKDEILLASDGLFANWSSNYWLIPTADASSPIYPKIIANINV